MKSERILLFANTYWYFLNFRLPYLQTLLGEYGEVCLVAPPSKHQAALDAQGFRCLPLASMKERPTLWSELTMMLELRRLFIANPAYCLHAFTVRCVLFGGLIARSVGLPRLQAITGLGYLFTTRNLKTKLLRILLWPIYRISLGGKSVRIIFQNQEDFAELGKAGLVKQNQCAVIRGSGVDLEQFKPQPKSATLPLTVLFVGRLLKEKGVIELLVAAERLRREGLIFRLVLAGERYDGNPSSLSLEELEYYAQQGVAEFVGHVPDVISWYNQADLVVLPSYREGTPKSLLEAAACGKPILASDIAGCRGVVEPNVNGLLVPARDISALADGLRTLLTNDKLRAKFCAASRPLIAKGFSADAVNNQTLRVMRQLGIA